MQLLHPLLEFQQGSHHYLQEQKVVEKKDSPS